MRQWPVPTGEDERVAGLAPRLLRPSGPPSMSVAKSGEDAERFVRGRVIMMIIEDRVAPLRGPAMVRKELLEAFGGRLAFGFDRAPIEEDGQRARCSDTNHFRGG